MKCKRINWNNGSILFAEHLEEDKKLAENWITSLFHSANSHYYGINELIIDEIALSNGILKINELNCILQDGTLIEYSAENEDYILTYDLNTIAHKLVNPTIFFLTKSSEDSMMHIEKKNDLGDIIPVSFHKPRAQITETYIHSLAIPFIEIYIHTGAFCLTSFSGPFLNIYKNNKIVKMISDFCLSLKKNIIYLNNQKVLQQQRNMEDVWFLNQCQEILINMETAYMNKYNAFDFYKIIWDSIAKINWRNMNTPKIIEYYHMNVYQPLNDSLDLLSRIITGVSKDYKSENFLLENNIYKCLLNNANNDILILIYPNNSMVQEWIMNTIIGSESMFLNLVKQRNSGIERELINSHAGVCVIKLNKNSEYLKFNENLCIHFSGNLHINSLSLYIKKDDDMNY
jgi:predicted component of type VI protein secretion system